MSTTRQRRWAQLRAVARRHARHPEDADDLLADALCTAVAEGRADLACSDNRRWLCGVIRLRAAEQARMALRRIARETAYASLSDDLSYAPPEAPPEVPSLPRQLPAALRQVALLALSGHDRREIAYLLGISDVALRQRIVALRRRLDAPDAMPVLEFTALDARLAHGRIRQALRALPAAPAAPAFGSHDPDGHLFVVACSRNGDPRQRITSGDVPRSTSDVST